MHSGRVALIALLMLVAGCAGMGMSPGAKLRNEIFWEAATQCEGRYRTLHLDRIDIGGGITMRADAETRSELAPFRECYKQAVQDRVEQRRRAGLPVPEELSTEPTAGRD